MHLATQMTTVATRSAGKPSLPVLAVLVSQNRQCTSVRPLAVGAKLCGFAAWTIVRRTMHVERRL